MDRAKRRRPFTARFKLNIIQLAKLKGNRAAGREYGIDESVIRRWRANEEKLRGFPENRKANRGQSSHHPQLEQELVSWIKSLEEAGRSVSTVQIRTKALDMAKVLKIIGFLASPHWCWRFMQRHKLSIYRRTSIGQKPSEDRKKNVCLPVRQPVENVCSSSGQRRRGKIQELEEKLEQVTKERNKYKRKYLRLVQQIASNYATVNGDSVGTAIKFLPQDIPPSNCPLPRDHVLQDWTTQGQAVTAGVNLEQSLKEDAFLVRIKEEGPLDELWSQEAEPVRYNATVAGNVSAQLTQEPVELRYPELKAEPQEVEVAQGVSIENKQIQSDRPRGPSHLVPITKEEEDGNADESEHFLPFLPQIEQAFGYFHSNPISPEQPEAPPTPPQFSGPGTSAEALSVSLGNGMAYVSPPMPRAGRGLARRPIMCPVCQKQVLAPSELTKHMRSHTGERPFPCSICGMHFSLKSSLKTHERLHSGLRPYRCSQCGKDYTLSHHLKRHMRSHFRERSGATQLQTPEQLVLQQQQQGPQSA